jgi:hypothetical protein
VSGPTILREYTDLCEASNRAAMALGRYHYECRNIVREHGDVDEQLLDLESEYGKHQPRLDELYAMLRAEADGSEKP